MDEMTKFRSLLDQHGIQWRGFTGSIASRPVERTYFQIGGYIWSVIYATHSYPECIRKNCFACVNSQCKALVENDFGDRPCPFYKTSLKIAEEEIKRIERENRIEA